MSSRARDLLLTWGRFSPQYLARARFDDARTATDVGWGLARLACRVVGAPAAAAAFYLVPLPGPDGGGLWPLLSYVLWVGCVWGPSGALTSVAVNKEVRPFYHYNVI